MKKRVLALLLIAALLSGCAGSPIEGDHSESPLTLIYYTIGTPDRDLALVNEALNKLLLPRYGFTVEYHKIGWNDYTDRLNAIMNTAQDYDVAFTWSENYAASAQAGAFLALDDYLAGGGKALYEVVDERFWRGVTVNGSIYGVPTNKELANPIQFLFSRELVEKYKMDVSQCRTLKDLEPFLAQIAQEESGCIPLFLDSGHLDLMAVWDYEYVGTNQIPLVVQTTDDTCRVVNLYETPEARETLEMLRRYYVRGYINQDAPLRTSFSRFPDEQVFCRISSGGPDSDTSFSTDFGYPILSVQASRAVVTSISTQGGIMAVNANSAHKKEAMTFLLAVNTDPDVRNLLNYGVEGIHYEMTESGQVRLISQDYRAIPYTQGNWFLLHTMVGESPDKWEQYRAFNDAAVTSPLLGFSPDYSQCMGTYRAVMQVCQRYEPALMTGSVGGVGAYLPKLVEELKAAGIDMLIEEVQCQVDAYLAAANE